MDGIEFGQVEYREPESELRPDRNRKYAVVGCGEVDKSQLPIFVDLDVMRDMEGHARTNTHVELGGVMLGGKYVDDEGQPFVVVHEALRAEHYEATRGSFKFTHETWAQISRDREQFPEDLHLVGWYHTHPDWGVFLSGMDMFICDNFFNDKLDVALVIDPCRGDRGWFFWDDVGGARQKKRVSGFYLFANRYRRTELLTFADAFAVTNSAFLDPRYETPMGETAMQPVVNIHDQKSPVLMVAVLGMLTVQMLVLGLIGWRMLTPAASKEQSFAGQQREQLYREVLGQMVESSPAGTGIIQQFENVAAKNEEMKTDLDGRLLRIQELSAINSNLNKEYEKTLERVEIKSDRIVFLDNEITKLKSRLKVQTEANADIKAGKNIGGLSWMMTGAIALATCLAGLMAGTFIGRRFSDDDDDYRPERKQPTEEKDKPVEKKNTGTPDLTFGDSDNHPGD